MCSLFTESDTDLPALRLEMKLVCFTSGAKIKCARFTVIFRTNEVVVLKKPVLNKNSLPRRRNSRGRRANTTMYGKL